MVSQGAQNRMAATKFQMSKVVALLYSVECTWNFCTSGNGQNKGKLRDMTINLLVPLEGSNILVKG